MAEVSIPKFGTIFLSIISFIKLVESTAINKFFHWWIVGWVFGWIFDFVQSYYEILASVVIAVIFLKWTKNAYVLFVIAILAFLFLRFGLKGIGVA